MVNLELQTLFLNNVNSYGFDSTWICCNLTIISELPEILATL
jgi:hypothetical protein